MLIRCFAREKESEGKRRRVEDSRPEILAHPCLALGRKIAAKFRKPRGDEPRHLVLVPDAQRQERSLHPSLSYLAHVSPRSRPYRSRTSTNSRTRSCLRQPFAATSSSTIIRGR